MSKKKKVHGVTAIYQYITDRIVNLLENESVIPWRAPWNKILSPQNFHSKTTYKGINMLLTSTLGYRSPYFLTYRQLVELGGSLKDDAKGNSVPIVYWNWLDITDKKTGEVKKVPFLRYYRVFNVEHIEGLKFSESELYPQATVHEVQSIEAAENLVMNMPNRPKMTLGNGAAYSPTTDTVIMPKMDTFADTKEFYASLFHELAHSTGHSDRLSRASVMGRNSFGTPEYSKEELIAELGAAFLCAQSGISEPVIKNQAAYIKGWLKALKNDPRMLIQAAGAAQRACNYVMGLSEMAEGTGTEAAATEQADVTVVEAQDQPVTVQTIKPEVVVAENPVNTDPFQGTLFPVAVIESPKRKRTTAAKAKAKEQKPKKESIAEKVTRVFSGKPTKVVRK